MTTLLYDGSYFGFLTALFELYEYRFMDASIVIEQQNNTSLFGKQHIVITDETKAKRVLKKLQQELTAQAYSNYYRTFLSELKEKEKHLMYYAKHVIKHGSKVLDDYGNPDVLFVQQTAKKVHREKHRMEAFVRFQLTKDGLYYAIIQPDYNVLPLIAQHFKDRYADQRWLIYDVQRKYGIYYDLSTVTEVSISFDINPLDKQAMLIVMDEAEPFYQSLWQQYFSSVNIASRKNTKLHVQHMPKRYWKYLTEKA